MLYLLVTVSNISHKYKIQNFGGILSGGFCREGLCRGDFVEGDYVGGGGGFCRVGGGILSGGLCRGDFVGGGGIFVGPRGWAGTRVWL